MSHYGKILGFILGWMALRHPAGAVLGLILGHVLDAGWLRSRGVAPSTNESGTDAYGLLGVDPAASDEDVHAAYRKRISEYHPDKVQNAAQEIRELAEQRARAINQAYDSILKQRRASRPDA